MSNNSGGASMGNGGSRPSDGDGGRPDHRDVSERHDLVDRHDRVDRRDLMECHGRADVPDASVPPYSAIGSTERWVDDDALDDHALDGRALDDRDLDGRDLDDRRRPDGIGDARIEAEGELALGRIALDAGDPAHAAEHVAAALGEDPTLPDAYDMLRELDVPPMRARDFFPLTSGATPGVVAARSYLAARAGHFNDALNLLAVVAAMAPTKAWTAGAWLDMPGVVEQVDPTDAAESLLYLALRLDEPVAPELLPTLRPYLDFARRLIDTHGSIADVRSPLSGLARRLGAVDEAISWCERSERISPSARSAIMLGYAFRAAGRFEAMIAAWQRAVQRDPANVDVHLDLAEHLDRVGRRDEALVWVDRALAIAPTHRKAFPSACEMRFRASEDIGHLVRLVDHWRANPEHTYADDRLAKASDGRLWLRFVPPPAEASANLAREVYRRRSAGSPVEIRSTAASTIEPPSAVAAFHAALPGAAAAHVFAVPSPDPRGRFAPGSLDLWRFVGTRAVSNMPTPSVGAVATLRDVATGLWPHPVGAYQRAAGFAGIPLDDLLGLLVRVPTPTAANLRQLHRTDPFYWPRFAQAWTCLGILHHRPDEPWNGSTRRRVLVDIANGVEDWTTDAALFALVTAAWIDPTARADVAEVVARRFAGIRKTVRRRPVSIAVSVASLVLLTPGIDPAIRRDAQRLLAAADKAPDMESLPAHARRAFRYRPVARLRHWMRARRRFG